jgi:hypothetical protein
MVKDNWFQSSSSSQADYSLKAITSDTNSMENTSLNAAVTTPSYCTTQASNNNFNVWGVYESKEKLIELHIC